MRMQQRGYRPQDIDLVQEYGTQLNDDCYILLNKDVECVNNMQKQIIQHLKRLMGTMIVVIDERLVTCYRPNKKYLKKLRRRIRQ